MIQLHQKVPISEMIQNEENDFLVYKMSDNGPAILKDILGKRGIKIRSIVRMEAIR